MVKSQWNTTMIGTATADASQQSPRVTLPTPLEHQRKLILDPARFKLALCGRRWGKTGAALMMSMRGHGPRKGFHPGALDGKRIWWVAPTYPQIKNSNIWEDLKRATKNAAVKAFGGSISEEHREIRLPNGGTIAVRSADNPDSLRGPGLDGMVVDEAAFIPETTWGEVLRPMLADRNGWALLITTPNGRNWIHRRYLQSQAGDSDWKAWQCPSWENPLLTPAELESMRREIGPRRFAQEIAAQFTETEGALFPGSYFDAIRADRWPDSFDVSAMYLDPSLGKEGRHGDYQAIVFVGLSGGLLWVDALLVRQPPNELIGTLYDRWQTLQPTYLGAEANGFQSLLSPLADAWCRERGKPPLPVIPVTNSINKALRIQRLDPHLSAGRIKVLRNEGGETLIEQLQMFPASGYHDDGPDALDGAIQVLQRAAWAEEQAEEQIDFVAV